MAGQEFLASFAVEIDEAGVSRLQQVLEENRELADEAAAAFEAAAAAIRAFEKQALGDSAGIGVAIRDTELTAAFRDLARDPPEQVRDVKFQFTGLEEPSASPLDLDTAAAEEALEDFRKKASEPVSIGLDASGSLGEGNDRSGKLNMDLTEAKANLEAFRKDASKPVPLSGNASGMVSAARSAYNSIKNLFSTPITIKAAVETEAGEDGEDPGILKMSAGGRFSRPTDVQVAEDGDAEYIIPVKKEDRAVPLLRQLLSELSPAARESLGGAGEISLPDLSAGTAAAAQITNNNSNVSAPVTIQVRASGADAERIGRSVYDTAERYLLRTLRSAAG